MFTSGRHMSIRKEKPGPFAEKESEKPRCPNPSSRSVQGETVQTAGQMNHQSLSTKPLKVDV